MEKEIFIYPLIEVITLYSNSEVTTEDVITASIPGITDPDEIRIPTGK